MHAKHKKTNRKISFGKNEEPIANRAMPRQAPEVNKKRLAMLALLFLFSPT
jgi:hypothetical protein